MFGSAYEREDFVPAAYTYQGAVKDFFGYFTNSGTHVIPRTRANLRDKITLQRIASIWHESPIAVDEGVAFIAARVANRQLGELTALASGLVPQWDGAEWTGLAATRNPAPHYRDRLAKLYPPELIGDGDIRAWGEYCDAQGYELSAVLRDGSVMDALNLIASAGRARPRQSEVWDILVDRDTSDESPVQTFSARNVRNFSFDAAFPDLPGGFRVRFNDADRDYREREIIVRDPAAPDLSKPLEELVNSAQDTEAAVTSRALFDLRQARARMAFYQFEVPAIGIVCRRGDVVAVQHDVIAAFAGFARIVEVVTNIDDEITGLVLDGTIPMPISQAWSNIAAAWSSYSSAFADDRLGVAIRLRDRSELIAEILPSGDGDESNTVTFAEPLAANPLLTAGCHLVSGPLGREYTRMKVNGANYKNGMTWVLVCVDEANEIHEE
jgi:hypothetical protein